MTTLVEKKPITKTRITALKNCLSFDERHKSYQMDLTVAHIEEGMQTFCDGYVALALHVPVPEIETDLNEGYKIVSKLKDASKNEQKESATETKLCIETGVGQCKKERTVVPVIVEKSCKIGFNPRFMENVIVGLGGYKNCTIAWPNNPLLPIYIESELGMGMVIPYRIK